MKIVEAAQYALLMAISMTILYACGGSSGGSSGVSSTTGSAFASHIDGAIITVKDKDGNIIAGPVTTSADGSFNVTIPAGSNSDYIIIESTGGTFTDEATGLAGVAAGPMAAYIKAGALGSSAHLTPASTIIHNLVVNHGLTITEAETAFEGAFGYLPDITVKPVDATFANASTFSVEQRLAGLRAATFSQLSKEFGASANPEQQFAMFTALAQDLADGTLNGLNSASPVTYFNGTSTTEIPEDIKRLFVNALLKFRTGGNDKTDLNSAELGTLPFSYVAFTNISGYRVEFIEGMMPPTAGRTTFDLSITDSEGAPLSGLDLKLKPKMYMGSGHTHGTPIESQTDNGDGTYTFNVYFAMGSVMMDGSSMGFWEIEVSIEKSGATSDKAYFYPPVMMKMGSDTFRATLNGGQTDMIAGMMMEGMMMAGDPLARKYLLFNDGLTKAMDNTYSLDLFIAAENMAMLMANKPLTDGITLTDESDATWTVGAGTSVVVTYNSVDYPALDNGDGHWIISGLPLMAEMTYEFQISLTVNDSVKVAADGVTEYATIMASTGAGMQM
ncbi:MAG: hypothetical protein OEV42_02220 [Deltaproteobacteria bacterium]|nr:hypothetical protein [Deltaproteobacteria bacterium]